MKRAILILTALAIQLLTPAGQAATSLQKTIAELERSVVSVEITSKRYDYFQPWARSVRNVQKNGTLIGGKEILTTADGLEDRTLIRVQRGGRGKWWEAEAVWVDYPANLAIVTVKEEEFWKGLKPVKLATSMKNLEKLQIVRWRNGNLEIRQAEFNEFTVNQSQLSDASHVQMQLDSDIEAAGWAEPIWAGGAVAGLTTANDGKSSTVIPASFIRSVVAAHKKDDYKGLGFFDFVWQPAANPAILEYVKLPGEPRGVIIIDVPKKPGKESLLKPKDVLLEVDGFAIDIQGDYEDPEYGFLMLENLSTRYKWAGDTVKLKIARAGEILTVDYVLPKVSYTDKLLAQYTFDKEPEYLIAGGLIFQPLNEPYLRGWGGDWQRRAPFRLNYYRNENGKVARSGLVVLSQVLPDLYNLGYQDTRYLVVDQVNGKKISKLTDLSEALQNPPDGFHVIEFMQGDSLRKIVLDAKTLEQATKRVLQRYGITSDRYIAPAKTASAAN